MDKRKVVELIREHLAQELDTALEERAEERADELRQQLLMYKHLPLRQYGPDDVVCPSALVELELGSTRAYYFIVPQGGGLITQVDGRPVQVITPLSPMGEALLGKREGDVVAVESRGTVREYKVISLS